MQKIGTLGTGKWLRGTSRMHSQLLADRISDFCNSVSKILFNFQFLFSKSLCLKDTFFYAVTECQDSLWRRSHLRPPRWLFLLCVENLQLCRTERSTMRGGIWCICGIYGTIGIASFLMIPNGAQMEWDQFMDT